MDASDLYHFSSIVGSVAFALSGLLVGTRKMLDLMDLSVLAFVTANGGGVLRDLLISRPPALIQDAEPFIISGGAVLLAAFLRLHRKPYFEERWYFLFCDSLGLVAFSLPGALIGLQVQAHCFGVLTLSLLTAVGGGIIRDILVNETPVVLHAGFYGTVALLQSLAIYTLHGLQLMSTTSLVVVSLAALVLRLVASHWNWQIPKLV